MEKLSLKLIDLNSPRIDIRNVLGVDEDLFLINSVCVFLQKSGINKISKTYFISSLNAYKEALY
jgi:hypothetical protein